MALKKGVSRRSEQDPAKTIFQTPFKNITDVGQKLPFQESRSCVAQTRARNLVFYLAALK